MLGYSAILIFCMKHLFFIRLTQPTVISCNLPLKSKRNIYDGHFRLKIQILLFLT